MLLIKHFRHELPHRIRKKTEAITVAVEILSPSNINLAFAVCDKTDSFNKKKGRIIAEGRLFNARDRTPNVFHQVDPSHLDIILGADCFHPSIQSARKILAEKIQDLITYELTLVKRKKEAV